jgi:hypothetical protein
MANVDPKVSAIVRSLEHLSRAQSFKSVAESRTAVDSESTRRSMTEPECRAIADAATVGIPASIEEETRRGKVPVLTAGQTIEVKKRIRQYRALDLQDLCVGRHGDSLWRFARGDEDTSIGG